MEESDPAREVWHAYLVNPRSVWLECLHVPPNCLNQTTALKTQRQFLSVFPVFNVY
jgi:hypothetical protein